MEYPKRKYAPTGGHIIVTDSAHELALGPGWLDNEPPAEDLEKHVLDSRDLRLPIPGKRAR